MRNVVSVDDHRLIADARSAIGDAERIMAKVQALTAELGQRRLEGWELGLVRRPGTRLDLRVIEGRGED